MNTIDIDKTSMTCAETDVLDDISPYIALTPVTFYSNGQYNYYLL
jgi:hypothetical protein